MTQDHPATQVHSSLEPRPDEPVIVKRRVSAFSGSDLDVLRRGANADTLILAGISTSGVVLSTLRQAADLDYLWHAHPGRRRVPPRPRRPDHLSQPPPAP